VPTVYIVPALTDMAGQCRIYEHPQKVRCPRDHYRERPDEWLEAGIMNSRGSLVCAARTEIWEELKACEPLAAGLVFHFPERP
jgi:hypothetical protein